MISRRIGRAAAAIYVAAAVTLLVGCVTLSGTQSVLSSADLVAVWRSPEGGSIAFSGDHRFVATGLRLNKFWNGCAGTGRISASGTWQFLNSQGDSSVGSTGYSTGRLVDLSFDGAAGNPSIGCTGGAIKLTSWNVHSKPGLCLQMDPDTACDGYVFNRR